MSGDKKRKLPEGWRWKRLGRKDGITEIVNGSTPYTDVPEYWDGNILWVTPSDLGNFHSIYIENTERKITQAGLDSCSTTLLPVGTILLTSRAPVGNLAIANKPLCTNQGFKSFIPKDDINSLYLYFAIKKIIPDIQKMSHGNTFTEITKELVQDFEIPLPPTPADQLTIASDFERRMAHVEKIRGAALRQKDAIAAMQGAILREVFPYEAGDELPEGWRWKMIKDVIENNIQVFNPENYDKEKFIYIDISSVDNVSKKILNTNQVLVKDAPSRAKSILKENDIIISTVRPNLNAVALVDKSRAGNICSSGFCVIRLKNGYHAPYFFYYLTSPYFVEAVSNMVQGTMYPAIGNDDVKDFSIPLPPLLSDQLAIAAELERKISELEKARLTAQRQAEAIEALPGAILREVFDFEEENTGS